MALDPPGTPVPGDYVPHTDTGRDPLEEQSLKGPFLGM